MLRRRESTPRGPARYPAHHNSAGNAGHYQKDPYHSRLTSTYLLYTPLVLFSSSRIKVCITGASTRPKNLPAD